ncbi:hypothetical protein YC2023_038263 [Brassica napus]|uniref:(rape) hypothetical protein n=1 Tax=Brassica napus TaxID=3708 RepID=A0A816ICS4_BRANA|nr:unnamed protein product [Brassica napus]
MGCVFSFLGNQLPVPGRQLLSDHNRFQKTGTDSVYELKETHTGCLVKVDIPGCSEASWWVNDNNVLFFADEPHKGPFHGRRYGGTLVFDSVD